uniref:Putative conserved secreted protein ovary overexpressed n=1 Tax=Rhipicephalus microplus TaxID=6941 RepID=A0A6M2CPJ7_RHIMP
MRALCVAVVFLGATTLSAQAAADESVEEALYGVKYASRCEACKYLAVELEARLGETGKTHDVIETGYSLDGKRKRKKYAVSELRLVESLDGVCDRLLEYNIHKERKDSTLDGVCDRLLEYNIHKERKDSTRFAKGTSTTFRTLHGLVAKGVKVDLGIPYELWDSPSAEVTQLKSQCEALLEQYEADIERWYFGSQEEPLATYLCRHRVLRKGDADCLDDSGRAKTEL